MDYFEESADHDKSIDAVEVSDFAIEDLFGPQMLAACEAAIDEVVAYDDDQDIGGNDSSNAGGKSGAKRSLHLTEGDGGDERLSKKAKKMRKKKRLQEERWEEFGHLPRQSTRDKYTNSSQGWNSTLRVSTMPVKAGGYSAKASAIKGMPEVQTLQEAETLPGFVTIKCTNFDRPIFDHLGRVVAVLTPPPNDPSYNKSARRAFETMKEEGTRANFTGKDLKHKRGDGFAAINIGLSYGNGHTEPTRPDLGRFKNLAKALLGNEDIQRLASYQDAMYAFWHPKAYIYYKTNLDKLWEQHPSLAHPLFPRSIMPTVAFNLGNRVATKKHVDSMNCPFGWCTITALGEFDATKGGHIILWDLGLIIEFPAGACICIPSAIITHSNIPVRDGETRMSFTQYCSGEIFRYIENGFRTDASLKQGDPAIYLFRQEARKTRLQEGYDKFSRVVDLVGDAGGGGSRL